MWTDGVTAPSDQQREERYARLAATGFGFVLASFALLLLEAPGPARVVLLAGLALFGYGFICFPGRWR